MSSSSNSTRKKSVQNTTNNIDNSQMVAEQGASVRTFDLGEGSGDVAITYSDQGAIDAAEAIASRSLDTVDDGTRRALDFATRASETAAKVQRDAMGAVEDTGRAAFEWADGITRSDDTQNTQTLIRYGAAAAIAVVALPPLIRSLK